MFLDENNENIVNKGGNIHMSFKKEEDFENALIKVLSEYGWEKKILKYYTEKELIDNWAEILYENNRTIDRLNDYPLTDGEMQQIIEQITLLKTPLKLNSFINGKTVSITRDNPEDKLHFGKEISLKIYDRREIAAGQSRYQIAQQPKFKTDIGDRRGDLMLLINGMPVIHIELKRSGVPVSYACNQIERYSKEGVFSGIFSLVQIFVAMNPEETVYFANPGADGIFNESYYFHWADFNNEVINDWKEVAKHLLYIPMAHQLIGFYTVADNTDGILKVMRSYQYYAANRISDKVSDTKWGESSQLGGVVWHTTGSGKTMTSFKSAQLIANSDDADKVVFLTDRIELGVQSLKEYRNFAEENESVQATENTQVLISKLKSQNPADTLIVTSIQKMSNIKEDGLNSNDIDMINKKRLVFIVDEAHRSTFGDMLITIKNTFTKAIFFGFTGTPIKDENQKKMNTTASIFGSELHRYTIADGMKDGNVLGFDVYKVLTYKDKDIRKKIALEKAKAATEEEVLNDEKKSEIYYKYMNSSQVKMAGYYDDSGKYINSGIEDFLPNNQYLSQEHQNKVVEDIVNNWITLSRGYKFHAIFATSSIPEAIEYYRLFKSAMPNLKTTCLFDPHVSNEDGEFKKYKGEKIAFFKEEGLKEIIEDYNKRYEQAFTLAGHANFKKDIAERLAHKGQYKRIDKTPEKQIDLLIVVNQMLTGFDSKWINTLYLDKVLEYEDIIQAFSRTNRIFTKREKPFGIIKYYRRPHAMEKHIEAAVKLYSGDKPIELFVDKLESNLKKLNNIYIDIFELFKTANILNFEKLPSERVECAKFAKLFKEFNDYLEAAKIQGFKWNKLSYRFEREFVEVKFDETVYLILLQRYKDLVNSGDERSGGAGNEDIPFELDGYLTEMDTIIDAVYMNSRFEKYRKLLNQEGTEEIQNQLLNELYKSFAVLSQKEQKFAYKVLHDIQNGELTIEEGKTLRDYITEYQFDDKNDKIYQFSQLLGLDEEKLRNIMSLGVTQDNLREFGRFDELKNSVDKLKAKEYFQKVQGVELKMSKVNIEIDKILKNFILSQGDEINF